MSGLLVVFLCGVTVEGVSDSRMWKPHDPKCTAEARDQRRVTWEERRGGDHPEMTEEMRDTSQL